MTDATLAALEAPLNGETASERLSHLLAGGFNITTWEHRYYEWTQEHGVTELIDPVIPSFATGRALDNFLFVAGAQIPSTLLPPAPSSRKEDISSMPEVHYPATGVDVTHIGDHIPILLPLPCELIQEIQPRKKLRVNHLTSEELERRDAAVKDYLQRTIPSKELS